MFGWPFSDITGESNYMDYLLRLFAFYIEKVSFTTLHQVNAPQEDGGGRNFM